MKKLLAFLLAASCVLGAAGCNGDSSSSTANSGTVEENSANGEESSVEAASDPITISFWNGWTGADGEILTEYVEEFNEVNPYGITIEMDINPEFLTKISAALPEIRDRILFWLPACSRISTPIISSISMKSLKIRI